MYSLFTREEKIQKLIVDPAKLEAKVKFLESGAPDSIRFKVDSIRSESIIGNPAQFPTVNHVQQKESDNSIWNLHVSDLSLKPSLKEWDALPLSAFPLSNKSSAVSQPVTYLRPPENIKACLQEFKNQESNMTVKAVYKTLRSKKKKFGNSFDIWTEVYKPQMVSDIIGNTENINKLKSWLQVQKNVRKRDGSESSGNEFIDSDSGGEGQSRTNNMAILAGPYGCGKTSAVYAVASELGIEVLEINSSCNRTGKRLLADFSESTQSHNVDLSQPILGMFNLGSSPKPKLKKKSKPKMNDCTSGKTTLLLVEDADILFTNHDEGFVSAVVALISTSKRPVILTVNDKNCTHLSKFETFNRLQLTFNKPRASKLVLWLCIVALVEGVKLSGEQSQSLVEWSDGDVRRSLLQLQLVVQSKMLQTITERSLTSLWWDWPAKYNIDFQLPTLVVKDDVEEENVGIVNKEKILSDIKSIAKYTDNLVHMDLLSSKHYESLFDNPCPKPWQISQIDATSLSEYETHNEFKDSLHVELSSWLVKTMIGEPKEQLDSRFPTSSEKKWCSLLRKANDSFLSAVSLSQQCSHQALSSDYIPALRTLGRAEQIRLATYTKRANRYFSYLKGLGINANKSLRDFMCDCFSQDCL